MPPKFKPKKPKARKPKTAKQKAEDAKRNKAASQATDQVSMAQRRQQRLFADPTLFLTEGLGSMAQAEVLKQYNKVLAYNKQKEEADDGPTYSPGSPPPSPVSRPPSKAPSFPPGVLIKKKNPNKAERAHNRDIKRQQGREYFPEPSYPEQDMASYLAENEAKEMRNQVGLGRTNYNELPTTAPSDISSFNPKEYIEPSDFSGSSTAGDYIYELQLAQQNQLSEEMGNYTDILTEQRETQQVAMVGDFVEEGRVDVVRMTDEEKNEILAQRSELLKKKKEAKTAEEKDYYKRAIADLKAGDTQATRSRKKEREQEALSRAGTSFTPQVPGIKKYPGPANIVNDMIVVSTEVGRRDLDEYEEQQYMGGGIAGQTEVFTSVDRELNDEYQRYANRKSQKLSKLREMGGTIKGRTSAFDEVPEKEDSMTEEQMKARLDRIPNYPPARV